MTITIVVPLLLSTIEYLKCPAGKFGPDYIDVLRTSDFCDELLTNASDCVDVAINELSLPDGDNAAHEGTWVTFPRGCFYDSSGSNGPLYFNALLSSGTECSTTDSCICGEHRTCKDCPAGQTTHDTGMEVCSPTLSPTPEPTPFPTRMPTFAPTPEPTPVPTPPTPPPPTTTPTPAPTPLCGPGEQLAHHATHAAGLRRLVTTDLPLHTIDAWNVEAEDNFDSESRRLDSSSGSGSGGGPCVACPSGTYQENASDDPCQLWHECEHTEYQTVTPSVTSDRACTALTAVCKLENDEYESVSPTPTSDRICTPITACGVDETYEVQPPSTTSDRVCSPWTVCDGLVEHQIVLPTATSDRVCLNHTVCVLNQTYEVSAPTEVSNRACNIVRNCTELRPEVTAPTLTSDRVCSGDCVLGVWGDYGACSTTCGGGTKTRTRTILLPQLPDGNPCVGPMEETIACGNPRCPCIPGFAGPADDVCTACEIGFFADQVNQDVCTAWTICPKGKYVSSSPSRSSDRQCLDCFEGRFSPSQNNPLCISVAICKANEIETTSPTASSNRVCTQRPDTSTGVSDGEIAGIAVGVVLGIGLLAYLFRDKWNT